MVYESDEENEESFKFSSKFQHKSKRQNKRKIGDEEKAEQAAVITSAQAVGWREPYDNFTFGNNRSGMCQRTFVDRGHL